MSSLPGWREPRSPDFWLLVLLVLALGFRLLVLTRALDWFVSFVVADDFFYYAKHGLSPRPRPR
jgi:hypothetical protein